MIVVWYLKISVRRIGYQVFLVVETVARWYCALGGSWDRREGGWVSAT